MSYFKGLGSIARTVFKPGDPIAYLCLALIVIIVTLGMISIIGTDLVAYGHLTIVKILSLAVFWLVIALIIKCLWRSFRS